MILIKLLINSPYYIELGHIKKVSQLYVPVSRFKWDKLKWSLLDIFVLISITYTFFKPC